MYEELIIAGAGGQGSLFAGDLIAEAHILKGRNVALVPLYGPEKRKGKSMCSVIVSDEEIGCHVAEHPDVLIAMNQSSLDEFLLLVKPGGLVIGNGISPGKNSLRTDIEMIQIDADAIAHELGNNAVANIVMVGAYMRKRKFVEWVQLLEGLQTLLRKEGKEGVFEVNRKALERGVSYWG